MSLRNNIVSVFFILLSICSVSFSLVNAFRKTIKIRCSGSSLYGSGKPVEVKFEPSGKVIMAEQGDSLADVAKKAGVNIPFNCKQGRCTSCEVRLNGKVSAKVCQGTLIPSGPTKKLMVQVINTKPLK